MPSARSRGVVVLVTSFVATLVSHVHTRRRPTLPAAKSVASNPSHRKKRGLVWRVSASMNARRTPPTS